MLQVIQVGPKLEPLSSKSGSVVDGKNLIELGTAKTEVVPSPASDATTSTRDTVTPNSGVTNTKPKKPVIPRYILVFFFRKDDVFSLIRANPGFLLSGSSHGKSSQQMLRKRAQ